jgi:biopolymer transport protein ExbB/TolQ
VAQAVEAIRDFSVIGMVQHADPVVQGIALVLVGASVASWAITFQKIAGIRRVRGEIAALETQAADGRIAAPDAETMGGAVAQAALSELADAVPGEPRGDLRARLERAMRGAVKGQLRAVERGLPFLATVGSTTPFVGLLGTVWGIMHSFTSIAQSRDTSLAVVAPGIAEALFVTALGLFAAIPAVIAYNMVSVALGQASERAGKSVAALAKVLSRGDADKVRPIKGIK